MYLFGRSEILTESNLKSALIEADARSKEFQLLSMNEVIEVLDSFSKKWGVGSSLHSTALKELARTLPLPEEQISETLGIIPYLLSRSTLQSRIKSELGSVEILDQFINQNNFAGSMKAIPLGKLLHVSAGNVFLGAIDSLLMGFITKNVSILKVSSKNNFFPLYFAQELAKHDVNKILTNKFCVVSWKGGKSPIENKIKNSVNGILAWGGEEMLAQYKKGLASTVKIFEYGPKISIQVLSKSAASGNLKSIAEKIVRDVITWDQSACASPQNLWIESGTDEKSLINLLSTSFEEVSAPRGKISGDEAVELLKEEYRAKLNSIEHQGTYKKGKNYLIHLDPHPFLRPSPLNRTLIIKRFHSLENLSEQLKNFSHYLQTCGLKVADHEKESFLNTLAQVGVKRFTEIGKMLESPVGAPHDGRFGLRELVHLVAKEESHQNGGYQFASGGTTGNPKFSFFTLEDFDRTSALIAKNYQKQGLKPGMVAANLFAAGKMWSSFLATHKALEKSKVIQLPIGMNSDHALTLSYLERFQPDVILGIPSTLIALAKHAEKTESKFRPKIVFYAGESLNNNARNFLQTYWNPERIGSAGYASVDAGMIGYQCSSSHFNEHHVFSEEILLETDIQGQALVTHKARSEQPLKQYPTGDIIEWIHDLCACGSKDPKFKLLGRMDSQMNVFGCRFQLQEIEQSFAEESINAEVFQVRIEAKPADHVELFLESRPGLTLDPKKLIKRIYQNSNDVKKTLSETLFEENFSVTLVEPGSIERNPRTGKVKTVVDFRKV